jgi:gluconolactonase
MITNDRITLLSLFTIITLVGCASQCKCPEVVATEGIIEKGAKLKEISAEFKFTEGPATDRLGNVYFTDQPNNRIMIYTVDGTIKTFMQPSGRANGMYFDEQGNLIACADEHGELWQIDIKTGKHKILAHLYNGKRLNEPNDTWVRPKKGGLYFTDPYHQRPWWTHNAPTQDVQGVYFLSPDGTLIRIVDDLQVPNGIIGTPDGKTLYVADRGANKTYVYTIEPDGMLSDKKLFCDMGSDGMTIDCCGNVYLTNDKGVTVFNPSGEQIEQIKVPQTWTANVTFSGPDNQTLFITAKTGIYTLKMNVCGAR